MRLKNLCARAGEEGTRVGGGKCHFFHDDRSNCHDDNFDLSS